MAVSVSFVHHLSPLFMDLQGSLLCSQDPVLNQIIPFDTFMPHYFVTYFSDIFPSTTRSSEWYLPFRFCSQHFSTLPSVLHAPSISSSLISSP